MIGGPRGRWLGIGLLTLVLLLTVAAVAVAQSPGPPEDPFDTWPDQQASLRPSCARPPCEPSRMLSGGDGGYIPVTPHTLYDTAARVARRPATPLAAGQVRAVKVRGTGPIPGTGVGAVVLRLTASGLVGDSALTVWRAGSRRPGTASLVVEHRRTESGLVVVRPGTRGTVLLASGATAGRGRAAPSRARVSVDVVGWFPSGDGMVMTPPARILDTAGGVGARRGKLRGGRTVTLDVAKGTGPGRGPRPGYPAGGAEAAVLSLAVTNASRRASLTAWPAGEARPRVVNLTAEAGRARTQLAVVGVGRDGKVALALSGGRAHVSAVLVGWLRSDGTYRAIAGTRLLSGKRQRSRTGRITLQVANDPADGQAPRKGTQDEARVALLSVTAAGGSGGGDVGVRVWSADEARPQQPSVVVHGRRGTSTGLVFARLGEDGKAVLQATSATTRLTVDLVGWFTIPARASELEVPLDTNVPAAGDVVAVTGDSVRGATVTLSARAARVAVGENLVLGVTKETPSGLMGRVAKVVTGGDGRQTVTLVPTTLQEVFPQGDVSTSLGTQETTAADVRVHSTPGGAVVTSAVSPLAIHIDIRKDKPDAGEPPEDGKRGSRSCDVSTGGFAFDWAPIFNIDQFRMRWRWNGPPKVTFLVTVGAEAGIALEQLAAKCDFSIRIGSPTVVNLGPPTVPVPALFEFSLDIDLAAQLSTVEINPRTRATITLGVENNTPVFRPRWETSGLDLRPEDLLRAESLNASAMVDVWLSTSIKLYGVIGPKISYGPFAEAYLTGDHARPWFGLELGFAAKVALVIDLWFDDWVAASWTGEIPIALLFDDCGTPPYGPGWGGKPCRTPTPKTRADGSTPSWNEPRLLQPRVRVLSSGEAFPVLELATVTAAEGRDAKVGLPYSRALAIKKTFLYRSASWRTVAGSLPPGLVLDSSGEISGRPTEEGRYTFTAEARHPLSPPASTQVTIVVDPATSIDAPPSGRWTMTSGTPASFTLTARGGPPFAWTLPPAADRPPGIDIVQVGDTVRVTGTPSGVGEYPLRFAVADVWGQGAAVDVVVDVRPRPEIVRLSEDAEGREVTGPSGKLGEDAGFGTERTVDVSSTGRFVAFQSLASDLVPGDDNGRVDVFVLDRQLDTLTRVSAEGSSLCEQAAGCGGYSPSISDDGRWVVFAQSETPGSPEGTYVVLAENVAGGDRITLNDSPTCDPAFTACGSTFETPAGWLLAAAGPAISGSGRYVTYEVGGEIARYDRLRHGTGSTIIVDPGGDFACEGDECAEFFLTRGLFGEPTISDDGGRVAYTTGPDGDGPLAIADFVDREVWGNGPAALKPVLSGDGAHAAFFARHGCAFMAGTVDDGAFDVVGEPDREFCTGVGLTSAPAIDATGSLVAIATTVPYGGTDLTTDVFVARRGSGGWATPELISARSASDGVAALAPALSGNGALVTFVSAAADLVAGDTNGVEDVFAAPVPAAP